jgi:hypothetical protein
MLPTIATSFWPAIRFTFFAIAVCCVLTLLLGKDMHWDLYNYHLHTPHAFLHHSISADFMGSSWLQYINPVASLPFYLMVVADWPALIISMVLASIHALNIVLVWWICRYYLFGNQAKNRDWVALSTFLACISVVFIGLIGSSFTDLLTSIFILLSLAFLLHHAAPQADRVTQRSIWLAGLSGGIATGLKLTNVVLAFALFASIAFIRLSAKQRIKTFVFAGAAGYLMSNGWWAWQLYAEFGNPVFPLQNAIFKSPDFPAVSLHNIRFSSPNFIDWLTLPFQMIQHRSWIYYEVAAPDWRFALCVVLSIALCISLLLKKTKFSWHTTFTLTSQQLAFASFFIIGYMLWILTSSNARYGLPLMLLIGPACVYLVRHVIPCDFIGKSIIIIVAAIQTFVIIQVGSPRWAATDWTMKWMEYSVPDNLKTRSFGYLTLGTNSNGSLLPFLHPDSRFLNLTGLYVLDPNGPGAHRVQQFIKKHDGKLRMLAQLPRRSAKQKETISPNWLIRLDVQLAPWNLSIDKTDCEVILDGSDSIKIAGVGSGGILTCKVTHGNSGKPQLESERRFVDAAMRAAEMHCPHLFRPAGVYSVKQVTMWTRRYFDTDIVLYSLKGRLAYSRYDFGPWDVDIGELTALANGTTRPNCSASST